MTFRTPKHRKFELKIRTVIAHEYYRNTLGASESPADGPPKHTAPTRGSGQKVLSVLAEVEIRNQNEVPQTTTAWTVVNPGEKPRGLLMLAI